MCLECRLKCAVQPAGELPDPPDSEYGKKPESERKHVGNPGADPVLYESKSKGAGSSRNLYNNKHQYPYRIVPSYHLVAIYKRKRSEEHTSELQSRGHLVCRLLLEKKKQPTSTRSHYHLDV